MSRRQGVIRSSLIRFGNIATPIVLGIFGFVATPGIAAQADIASLFVGNASGKTSWRNYIVEAGAGSIHQSEMVFADATVTGALAGRGLQLDNGKRIAFRGETKPEETTEDADRVTRHLKKGRVVTIEKVRPPKDFTAGSILQRTSFLMKPSFDEGVRTAFIKPEIKGKELSIALAFHEKREEKKDFGVPVMLASLVTNDKADVLATAYADPTPDYASTSPFDAVLAEEDANDGRFIPEIGRADHAWAANPLPPGVFSKKEQNCLAEAIYFESAVEPLKGQAAVAQVVLNRVRNPAYPDTICGVVYQNENWYNRCQFSFACDRIPDIVWSRKKFAIAKQVALAVTAGKIWLKDVGSATHYHATYVHPDWAPTMKRVTKIGRHIFFRTYGGGWS